MEIKRFVIFDLISGVVVRDWFCSFLNGKTITIDFNRFGWSIDTIIIRRDYRQRRLIYDTALDYKLKMLRAIYC